MKVEFHVDHICGKLLGGYIMLHARRDGREYYAHITINGEEYLYYRSGPYPTLAAAWQTALATSEECLSEALAAVRAAQAAQEKR